MNKIKVSGLLNLEEGEIELKLFMGGTLKLRGGGLKARRKKLEACAKGESVEVFIMQTFAGPREER